MKILLRALLCLIGSTLAAAADVSAQGYFPLIELPAGARMKLSDYAESFGRLNEPSLFGLSRKTTVECYRIYVTSTFVPTFVVRVSFSRDGTSAATLKIHSWRSETKEAYHVTKVLSDEIGTEIRKAFSQSKFENVLPVKKEGPAIDGSPVVIEALVAGRYHIVIRESGIDDDRLAQVGAALTRAFGDTEQIMRPYTEWLRENRNR